MNKAKLMRAPRYGLPALVIACAAAAAVAATPRGGGYAIEDGLIAGGGVSQARGGCFGLSATIAQATAGTTAGGDYAIASGFWARANARPDQMFRDGFGGCAP